MRHFENVIYHKTLVRCQDAPDGETPTQLHLTRETNGYALIRTEYNQPETILQWWPIGCRDEAIEEAVREAKAEEMAMAEREHLARQIKEKTL